MSSSSGSAVKRRTILGVKFFTGTLEEAVALGLKGGLVVVPSAPVLVNATRDAATQNALLEADLAITDSGLMVLFWRLTRGEKFPRVSGLAYLKLLLEQMVPGRPGAILWVMPNAESIEPTSRFLETLQIPSEAADFYIAPKYPSGPIADPTLAGLIEQRQPAHVIMAIGGGVQEKLGHYLKSQISHRPAIHCTGAAIGFLNGQQVRIPTWADRFLLGWLFRCFQSPATFIPRYWNARRLVTLLWKYGEKVPAFEA